MDEMTVLSCHTRPVIHSPFTNHQKSLRQAIQSIQPTDINTNLEPALDLAYAVAQTKPNPEIIIFSDFQSISEELLVQFQNPPEEIKLHLIRIGAESDNVGIIQFRVRKSLVNAFDYQTLLTVVNASEDEKKFSVELYFNENLFDVRPYTLAPGESKSEIFSNFTFEGGKLKAVLDVTDALHTDNVAYATLPKRERVSVLLVASDNPFLEKALSVDEKLNLSVITPEEYDPNAAEYQVVIFDQYNPSPLGDGNYMFIYPPKGMTNTPDTAASNPVTTWEIGEPLETPVITDWERTHPILRHVHLENVQIGAAYQIKPPATAQVLARSFEAPILFVDTTPNRKIVFAAINILQSDLPLRIVFPVIVANTIQWFQQSSGIQEYHLYTGEILKQQIEERADQPENVPKDVPQNVTITGPGDRTWEIPIERGEMLFDQTQLAGFYELLISNDPEESSPPEDDPQKLWAVNLANEAESHIGAVEAVEDLLAESAIPSGASLLRYPPWIYLVFLAVGLSVVEWFLYQRRRID